MDVSHELGALRFVVDSPLSSKVAMFNQQVNQHKQSQLLNPFSNTDGRSSPKPTFSKDEYGKPLAGSLTEMRGQKANMHVLKEMLELCQIIDSEGYNVKDEPTMRVIPFGELFNIYNYISDKVVGILLRARKHKLVEFEGEMLFQRRDDDVPIFLLKPINEIRHELEDKIESIKRSGSPAPQATSVLLDKKGHGLDIPKGGSPRNSVSRTPSPQVSKAATPDRETVARNPSAAIETIKTQTTDNITEVVKIENEENKIQSQSLPASCEIQSAQTAEVMESPTTNGKVSETVVPQIQFKPDVNNNNNNNNNVPAIVIEATAVYEHPANTAETSEPNNSTTSNNPIENAASA